jgi:hypothetical protein
MFGIHFYKFYSFSGTNGLAQQQRRDRQGYTLIIAPFLVKRAPSASGKAV